MFKTGQGQPICVTHLYSEFNASGNRFANMFADYCTVYLVNLRGCGQSTDDTSIYNYSMQDSISDLEAIRLKLGFENWGFAGHSTGGMLALTYAIHASQSLQYIVAGGLCASSDYMRHPASIYCRGNPNNKRIREILAMLRDTNSTIEQRQAGNKEWALMSLHKEESYNNMVSRPNSGKTVSKRLDYFSNVELPQFDLRQQLPQVLVKSYIYGGKYDAQCPYDYAVEVANLMSHASLTAFEESNHSPFIEEEQAFERFVEGIFAKETIK